MRKRILLRIVPIVAAVAVAAYAGDYLSLRFRIPNREQYGAVQVQRYYAVTLKNKKTEYMFTDPESVTCVHSLFPHFGDAPCWYLERNKRQRINVDPGSHSDFWRVP